jgi:hypothetical protein
MPCQKAKQTAKKAVLNGLNKLLGYALGFPKV